MDNFDLKKYLANNPLLKEENLSEDNIVSENLLKLAKKYIKDKHKKDVTDDQISFDKNVDMGVIDKFLSGNLSTFRIPSVTEGELSEGKKKKKRMLRALCHVGVYVICSILKTFSGLFMRLTTFQGGVGSRDYNEYEIEDNMRWFIRKIFENNTGQIAMMMWDVEQDYDRAGMMGQDREFSEHWHFKFFASIPKKALNLFWAMTALAIRIFQITGSAACATLYVADFGPAYILDKVREGFGMDVNPGNASRFEKAISKIIDRNNPFKKPDSDNYG